MIIYGKGYKKRKQHQCEKMVKPRWELGQRQCNGRGNYTVLEHRLCHVHQKIAVDIINSKGTGDFHKWMGEGKGECDE